MSFAQAFQLSWWLLRQSPQGAGSQLRPLLALFTCVALLPMPLLQWADGDEASGSMALLFTSLIGWQLFLAVTSLRAARARAASFVALLPLTARAAALFAWLFDFGLPALLVAAGVALTPAQHRPLIAGVMLSALGAAAVQSPTGPVGRWDGWSMRTLIGGGASVALVLLLPGSVWLGLGFATVAAAILWSQWARLAQRRDRHAAATPANDDVVPAAALGRRKRRRGILGLYLRSESNAAGAVTFAAGLIALNIFYPRFGSASLGIMPALYAGLGIGRFLRRTTGATLWLWPVSRRRAIATLGGFAALVALAVPTARMVRVQVGGDDAITAELLADASCDGVGPDAQAACVHRARDEWLDHLDHLVRPERALAGAEAVTTSFDEQGTFAARPSPALVIAIHAQRTRDGYLAMLIGLVAVIVGCQVARHEGRLALVVEVVLWLAGLGLVAVVAREMMFGAGALAVGAVLAGVGAWLATRSLLQPAVE